MKEIDTDLFGKIKVQFLIFDDKNPRIFIGKNEKGDIFLFHEFLVSQEKYTWIVKEIKQKDILLLNSGEKNIEEIFARGVLYYAKIEKNKKGVSISKKGAGETLNVKKITNDIRGFMTEQEYKESASKIAKFELDKMELSEKRDGTQDVFNHDDFEEIEIEKREKTKKEKAKTEEITGNYDDFEDEKFYIKSKKKKVESFDEYDEDLDNYEEFTKDEIKEQIYFDENGERIDKNTSDYFDDWDYKTPEKVAVENSIIENKKAKRRAKKDVRKQESEEEIKKFKMLITSPKLWTRVLLVILVLAMFLGVFLAVFASRGSGDFSGGGLQEPEVTETTEYLEE